MADEMELLKEWIKTSKNIVFFGGAGVSTESNIPDFRSTDGLYNQEYAYPPVTKKSQRSFLGFIETKCCFQMHSQMQRTKRLQGWSSREN